MMTDDWYVTLEIASQVRDAGQALPAERKAEFFDSLAKLEKMLASSTGKRDFGRLPLLHRFFFAVPLTPTERERVEALCRQLWQATGGGRPGVEETLMGQVAVAAEPESLPFWRAAMETSREKDVFQPTRRRTAVASVGFIAKRTGDAGAHSQLEAWLSHPDERVRAEAVQTYARVHQAEKGSLEASAQEVLTRIAREERAFRPRYLARVALHLSGAPVPQDAPEGVYAIKASYDDASRTVELASSDTLYGLASTILEAFGWDFDHLYEFSLTGDLRERRYVLPEDSDSTMPFFAEGLAWDETEDAEESEDAVPPVTGASKEEEGGADPFTLSLGQLGLRKGQRLIFFYDFGDSHSFELRVEDVCEKASPKASYPRVAAKTGRAPAQYSRW